MTLDQIWSLQVSGRVLRAHQRADMNNGVALDGRNEFFDALKQEAEAVGAPISYPRPPRVADDRMPLVTLSISDPEFTPDFFGMVGLYFASRRFREALKQWEGDIQYHPIRVVTGLAEKPWIKKLRDCDYRIFRAVKAVEVYDLEASRIDLSTVERGEAPAGIIPFHTGPFTGVFYAPRRGSTTIVATDAAMRLVEAGIDVGLFELTESGGLGASFPGTEIAPPPDEDAKAAPAETVARKAPAGSLRRMMEGRLGKAHIKDGDRREVVWRLYECEPFPIFVVICRGAEEFFATVSFDEYSLSDYNEDGSDFLNDYALAIVNEDDWTRETVYYR